MKKYALLSVLLFFFLLNFQIPITDNQDMLKSKYVQLSGDLFKDVQLSGIFKDSKTFVDAVPLKSHEYIRTLYDSVRTLPDFDLRQFVNANFKIPGEVIDSLKLPKSESINEHIETLWKYLMRKPEPENQFSTLLTLNNPYIVPGGRFREIYYWDSFFTILGLLADGHVTEAENMVKNFAYLVDEYKMIPNGNRVYYLTRSQPPFFALMVDIICRYKEDNNWGLQFLDQLENEYSFWMNGTNKLSGSEMVSERVVKLDNNSVLNRYYDFDSIPREESYREDFQLAQKFENSLRPFFYKNLRAAAESGWDFSSRWFKDGKSLITIQTTDILPVDLNCLLYFLENRLAFYNKLKGDQGKSKLYENKASQRLALINKIFWNVEEGYYFDYNWKTKTHTGIFSLAGCFPLYFGIASQKAASKVSETVKKHFLKPGGLAATNNETGQQWDAPNGWPPLQWMVIKGLREYGHDSLADDIKKRWLNLNENVYKRTGKMFEKYNVENLNLTAGGGEYPNQDGFGWTNGVAAALISDFDDKYLFKIPR